MRLRRYDHGMPSSQAWRRFQKVQIALVIAFCLLVAILIGIEKSH
jgi:hypothetical protein